MKILSLKQPWAWMTIHGGKDVENRTWDTKYRGPFLVHASKSMDRAYYDGAVDYTKMVYSQPDSPKVTIPSFEELSKPPHSGGIPEQSSIETPEESPIKPMTMKNSFKKRAREIQGLTGWSYMECLRLAQEDISDAGLEVLIRVRAGDVPNDVRKKE